MKGELFFEFWHLFQLELMYSSSWGGFLEGGEGPFYNFRMKSFFLIMPFNPIEGCELGRWEKGQWSCEKHLYSSPLLHTVEKREGSFPKYTSAVPDTEVSNYCHQNESHNSHSDDKDAIFVSPKLYCRLHQAKALSGNCWVLCTAHYKQLLP